jgi:hypothetical protein
MYGTLMYGTLKSWRIDLRSAPQKRDKLKKVLDTRWPTSTSVGILYIQPMLRPIFLCLCAGAENSQNYAQKPQRNCAFMNSASVQVCLDFPGLFLWLCCETDKKVGLYTVIMGNFLEYLFI